MVRMVQNLCLLALLGSVHGEVPEDIEEHYRLEEQKYLDCREAKTTGAICEDQCVGVSGQFYRQEKCKAFTQKYDRKIAYIVCRKEAQSTVCEDNCKDGTSKEWLIKECNDYTTEYSNKVVKTEDGEKDGGSPTPPPPPPPVPAELPYNAELLQLVDVVESENLALPTWDDLKCKPKYDEFASDFILMTKALSTMKEECKTKPIKEETAKSYAGIFESAFEDITESIDEVEVCDADKKALLQLKNIQKVLQFKTKFAKMVTASKIHFQRIDNLRLVLTEAQLKALSVAAEGQGVCEDGTGICTFGVELKSLAEKAANKKKAGLANSMGSFAGNNSDEVLKKYADAIGSQKGIDARNKVSAQVNKVNEGYKAKTNLEGQYDKSKDDAVEKGKSNVTDFDKKYESYDKDLKPQGITGAGGSQFENEKVKKGEVKKDNLEQIIASDTKENENKTSSYIKNLQDDTRLNVTARKETPRLYTNRTGYVKSSWKASDKFAAWDVVGAVDALLEGATSIEADTGSVGRVGQSTDQNSYSAAQINYRGVKTDPQSGGY